MRVISQLSYLVGSTLYLIAGYIAVLYCLDSLAPHLWWCTSDGYVVVRSDGYVVPWLSHKKKPWTTYPPVVKHGWLENGPFSWVIFLDTSIHRRPLPHLSTRGAVILHQGVICFQPKFCLTRPAWPTGKKIVEARSHGEPHQMLKQIQVLPVVDLASGYVKSSLLKWWPSRNSDFSH